MNDQAPRLLLLTRERPGLRSALQALLPGVTSAFLGETDPTSRPAVEAALLGSIGRDAVGWEPSAFPRLRFVQRLFAGVDDLPFDRIPPGVQIAGNVGGYSPFVAEHAVALALSSARYVREGHAAVAEGRARPAPDLRSLHGETAVILGYGSIGAALADRLRPFGARIVGVNRRGTAAAGCDVMFSADRLREAVGAGRFLFDARPLTVRTRGSIGASELRAMAEDTTFVNVGRGATVDEEALYRHLVDHPRFRAALDVWWDEDLAHGRIESRFPFASLPNFLGSPHWAGFSPHVEEYALGTALENLARFFRGEPPRHVVDRTEYVGRGAGRP